MSAVRTKKYDLLVIGETYVEFRGCGDIALDETYGKNAGGPDIYVAAAAARLGSQVALAGAVARDPFHAMIREDLLAEGINLDHVITCDGYNGIYFTSPRFPDHRERLFHRPGGASRHMTPAMIYDDLIRDCRIVYASSELQSVSHAARHTVFKAFYAAHTNDIMVAYDPNLRLDRWSLDDAKECLWSVLPLIDVLLISAPDESKALLGYERPLDVIGFLWDRGVSIVAVKHGAHGCMIGYDGAIREIGLDPRAGSPGDLSLIGSAFDGGFLHSVARGHDPFTAAAFANAVAQYKGIKGGGIGSLPAANDIIVHE